ncbi:MAG: adenylate/guanylate cyclase domain-containing protein [Fimbriimonadaceae bacterium]|nr:adenylate/guanylate cyclase domain-containing protein [Fimbriimonadaceae bacterium]
MSGRQGPLAFMFTDVEGSTRLWEAYPERLPAVIARHDELLTAAVDAAGGSVFKFGGDSCHAVFERVEQALAAAVAGQQRLAAEPWPLPQPLRVRMAIHCGPATARDGDYWGTTLNRLARLLALGHGGQILVSAAAVTGCGTAPAGWHLAPLGEYQLRDLRHPEQVSELRQASQPSAFPALRAPTRQQHNLPPLPTACLGREADLAALQELLAQHRLVSLVGSGGCGKTRLGLELAHRASGAGVPCWLVELGPLADERHLEQAVATVLGVVVAPGQSQLAATLEYLGGRALWLLLDNCEHLLAGVAELCDQLLARCPGVRLLATSREPLGVVGEQVYRVPSLPLPAASVDLAELAANPAVALFLDRAAAAGSPLPDDDATLSLAAEICRRLDGLPLALELAAAATAGCSTTSAASPSGRTTWPRPSG